MTRLWLVALCAVVAARAVRAEDVLHPDACAGKELRVQVLGSGGADLAGGRAASAYLVWIDGKARVLIDAGAGSALRFVQSGARARDLDAILFTQLRVDRTLDFPALVALALRAQRTRALPLYGPTGSRLAPSTVTFVRALLDGTRGAYRQLSDVLSPLAKDTFKLQPHDVRTRPVGVRRAEKEIVPVPTTRRFSAAATYTTGGGPPTLAWRVRVGKRSIVVSGAVNGAGGHLRRLAHNADILIVDHTVAGAALAAPASPSVIGRIATQAQVRRLVLSRRTAATLNAEKASATALRRAYTGPVAFADDLDCFALP